MPPRIASAVDVAMQFVTDEAALAPVIEAATDAGTVAIDTEFMRTDTYTPRLCIVQITAGERTWCIDELAGMDTSALWRQLGAGPGLRILHAAKQDLEAVFVTHGIIVQPIFDTQIAAGLLGHPPQVGYATLVREMLGIELDKAHTRADWSRRPLQPELLRYAAEDVIHLPELYARLDERLRSAGRDAWAREDSALLQDPALYRACPEVAWQRIGGLAKLAPGARLRACRLAQWREEQAIDHNRPRQWIMADRLLLAVADMNPGNRQALSGMPEMPAGLVRRQGDRILAVLADADADADADALTEAPPGAPEPIDKQLYRQLSDLVTRRAEALGIATELLATRREMTALIRGDRSVRPLTGWRREVIGEALLAALED